MNIKQIALRTLASLGFAALLGACGGGGGDAGGGGGSPTLQQPPAAAATIAQSAAEAQEAVKAALAGSATVVEQAAGLDSSFLLIGNPLGIGASPLSLASRVMASTREQPMAVQMLGCTLVFEVNPCSGSVTVDTNAPQSGATVWPAGTYFAMTFNALSGRLARSSFSMNGTARIDFLSAFDTNATSFANTRIQITASNLSGSVDGVAFGPESAVALIEFDSGGVGTLTVDGVRIRGLAGLTVTDANNFSLVGTVLRSAYWAAPSTYVDTSFTHWVVVAGRPQAGSTGSIVAGTASVAIGVTSTSATTVVYDVRVTAAAATNRYLVTATYPAGGGAPSYGVQPAP